MLVVKLIEKISNLFSYNKYYKMSTDDLEKEAAKYSIGSYFTGRIVRRESIIEQLITKDNASMFKKTIIISTFTLVIAVISLVISIITIFSR